MNPFDADVLFLGHLRNFRALAVTLNIEAREKFQEYKRRWLEDAAILKAIPNKTPGPKPVPGFVVEPLGSEADSPDQSKLGLHFTTEYVDDPNFDLPVPPPPNPENVVDVGPLNWGRSPNRVWAPGPRDTMPGGSKVPYEGVMVERVGPTPWGKGFYQEVKG